MERVELIWYENENCGTELNNEYVTVGTFGQANTWDIYDSDTFHHPMVPYDVLVDPLSLPSHPVIQERENIIDILYGEPECSPATNDSNKEKV